MFWEEKQSIKYEYIDGEVFAMTGGTIPHNDLAVNVTTALKNHLRGKACKVLMANAKVGIAESGPFHYPDVKQGWDSSTFAILLLLIWLNFWADRHLNRVALQYGKPIVASELLSELAKAIHQLLVKE